MKLSNIRKRKVILTLIYVVVAISVLSTVTLLATASSDVARQGIESKSPFSDFAESFHKNFIKDNRYMWLLRGLGVTMQITVGATVLGLAIGLVLAIIKTLQADGAKVGPLAWFVDIYLTVIRGTPAMVQLLIIYYVIFASSNPSTILVAILAFGINSGAYVAEIIRAGIMAVDKGQMEAGRSLGFSYAKSMRLIVIPQAVKNVLPAMFNELITLLKETSIAGYIAIEDLTRAGMQIRNKTYDAFMPLLAIAAIYLVIVMFLTWVMKAVERRLRKGDR